MNCQTLYDVREITGCVSGQDLHAIFTELVGEPSPSGKKEIPGSVSIPEPFSTLLEDKVLVAALLYEPLQHSLARAYAANGFIREANYAAENEISDLYKMPTWAAIPHRESYDTRFKYGYAF